MYTRNANNSGWLTGRLTEWKINATLLQSRSRTHTVLLFSCCLVQNHWLRKNGIKCCSYNKKVLVKWFSLTVWWLVGQLGLKLVVCDTFSSISFFFFCCSPFVSYFYLFVIICYPMCVRFLNSARIHMNSFLFLLSVFLLFVRLLAWLVSFCRDLCVCVHELFFSLCKSVCYSFNHSLNLKSKTHIRFLHTLNHLAWILFRADDLFFIPLKTKVPTTAATTFIFILLIIFWIPDSCAFFFALLFKINYIIICVHYF